ncbi:MAG: argininosuccinate lyase [Pseudothermotoga sp.]|uniref:argininosuccinate lyase n=1 Tax=Pseudothermotoga sp. TaxID=2033661 RepID=UPI0019C0B352|nr:argininosuccinate lyase [Pseudothermotoga sp.]MDK2922911.1 argininosuccinate lyase [Pseudothermotoga sp.]
MSKLWEKGYTLDPLIERFTVGKDHITDMKLIRYDIVASVAHAEMLAKTGFLSNEELEKLKAALKKLSDLIDSNQFSISPDEEDCHTAIENFLVREVGEAGKKIHTARSRNDQVLTALRLLYKDELKKLQQLIQELREQLKSFSKRFGRIKFAGFTHTRKAMPTNFRTWSMALYNALGDDLKLLRFVFEMIDQSPLGTGAGYGVPAKIDRRFTAQRLGFKKIQKNPIHTQLSRGKYEFLLLHSLSQISFDLNRFASDIVLFSLPEIGYLSLPRELCTGSSIMPHKLNPDPLELVRAYHNRIVARQMECAMITSNLITGYHRDFQLLKEIVLESFEIVEQLLLVMKLVFEKLRVNQEKCRASLTKEVLATERVYELVEQGIPFRNAYRSVAEELGSERE